MPAISTERLVTAYLAAWNCDDRAEREWQLHASWNEAGCFCDALVALSGRGAMADYIAGFRACHPRARFVLRSDVDRHHDHVLFAWSLIDAGGALVPNGCSVGEIDDDGRLHRLVAFFGPRAIPPGSTQAAGVIAKAQRVRPASAAAKRPSR